MTATPTYTDEKKRGWLHELFPQWIIHQVSASKLIATQILAKPILEEHNTDIRVEIDEAQYQRWYGNHQDLPEDIITKLAENRERNSQIAETYARNRDKYGRTIVFADRWIQCEYLRTAFIKRGVRADAIYSHVDTTIGGPKARNRREKDENAKVLERFRQGDLDVLINIRMLTEGTDIPGVNSVFLTRQTTSEILLTQMVGRALRGTKFHGTEEAHIVSFIDNWKQLINWAEYGQVGGIADPSMPVYGTRPPLFLISVELVRRLAMQLDAGLNISVKPFLEMLPIGWYRVECEMLVGESEETEIVRNLLLVFEKEEQGYRNLIKSLCTSDLGCLVNPSVLLKDVKTRVEDWINRFFPDVEEHFGSNLRQDVFSIAKHIAQNAGNAPKFFRFKERDAHDLDRIAWKHISRKLDALAADNALRDEYNNTDRYWVSIYPSYDNFKSQYDASVNRALYARRHDKTAADCRPVAKRNEILPDREPSADDKLQTKRRDQWTCLCCGSTTKRSLEVDHINPYFYGGSNLLDNLQTLCKTCNIEKGTDVIRFRDPQTDLQEAPGSLRERNLPANDKLRDISSWKTFVQRTVNFFYRWGAVSEVRIGNQGKHFRTWEIELNVGHKPEWLKLYLGSFLERIRAAKKEHGYRAPEEIRVSCPGEEPVAVNVHDLVQGAVPAPPRKISFTWKEYFKRLQSLQTSGEMKVLKGIDEYERPSNYLSTAETCVRLIRKYRSLGDMPLESRKYFCATVDTDDKLGHAAYFGSMTAAGYFKRRVIRNPKSLDKALNHIPFSGKVLKSNFDDFLAVWNHLDNVGPVSAFRLIAMKRPDCFMMPNSENKRYVAEWTEMTEAEVMNLEKYWQTMTSIWKMPWYLSSRPKGKLELRVWKCRTALLDALVYGLLDR